GQTPTASLMAFGVCPLNAWRTMRSRPCGVRRAFLCTFIRSLREILKPRQLQLPRSGPDGQPTESSHLAPPRASSKGAWLNQLASLDRSLCHDEGAVQEHFRTCLQQKIASARNVRTGDRPAPSSLRARSEANQAPKGR